MSQLLPLFFNNLFPILLVATIGYLLGKWLKISPRPLSQVIFYVFSPILVFKLMIESHLSNQDILHTLIFTIVLIGGVGLIAWLIGNLLHFDRKILAAVLLTCMFMNTGRLRWHLPASFSWLILFLPTLQVS